MQSYETPILICYDGSPAAVRAIEIKGQRLPDAVLVFSGVEAPPKK